MRYCALSAAREGVRIPWTRGPSGRLQSREKSEFRRRTDPTVSRRIRALSPTPCRSHKIAPGFSAKQPIPGDRYVVNSVIRSGHAYFSLVSTCLKDLLTKFGFPPEQVLEPASSNGTGHHESRQRTRKARPVGLAGFPGPRLHRQGRPEKADRYRRRQGRHVEPLDLREGDRQFGRI